MGARGAGTAVGITLWETMQALKASARDHRQGLYRVAIDAGRKLFDADPLFFRLGALRRARDRTMYENDPPPADELGEELDDCEELASLLDGAIKRAS